MISNEISVFARMKANARCHIFERKSEWAVRLYERMKASADPWLAKENADIRALLPGPRASYAYGLGVICPIDRTPLSVITWDHPGLVGCRHGHMFPNEQFPDPGTGYTSEEGNPHYFAARWNGFVVTELTRLLKPLACLYLITGEEAYAEKAAVILNGIADIYPHAIHGPLDYPGLSMDHEGGRLERPYYQTARHLKLYAEAYSFVRTYARLDEPSPARPDITMRDNIVRNLLANGGDYCYRESHKDNYWPLHNGTADYNMGALAAGLLCGIPEYTEWALEGRSSIRNMLANAVDYDGNYYETSLMYSLHTQSIYVQFAEMLYHFRSSGHPEGINLYDDPKFRAFYTEFKKKNSIAGRLPQYGDTSIDNMEWTGTEPIFNTNDFTCVMMMAVRTKDETFRQYCRKLLAEMDVTEERLARDDKADSDSLHWLLFHTEPKHYEFERVERPELPAEVLTGKGLVFLRYGKGKHERGLFMRYGATLNHGHLDELGLLIYDQGKEWSFDPGYYNTHYRFGWTMQTVAHLAATVNEASQLRLPAAGGSLDFFGTDGVISCAQASDPSAYRSENALLYTRFLAHIPVDEERSYYLDLFHVEGGQKRDYSFHAKGKSFSSSLEQVRTDSLPEWSGYEWGKQVDGDYKLKGMANEPFYWMPPGGGYRFFGNVSEADGAEDWHAVWEDDRGRKLRLQMLGASNRKLFIADGPDQMGVKYVLARDEGQSVSQYAAVIDTGREDFTVISVKRMALRQSSPTTVCFRVDTVSRVDYIYYSLEGGDNSFVDEGRTFVVSGQFCCLQVIGSTPVKWFAVNGSEAGVADNPPFRAERQESCGEIATTDYGKCSVTVDSSTLSGDPVGKRVHFSNPHYSHESCYTVVRAARTDDGRTELVLDKPMLLAAGKVSFVRRNIVYNEVELSHASNMAMGTIAPVKMPNDYFDSKAIVAGSGGCTEIVGVRGDYPFHILEVADGSLFRERDDLRIYDVKAGDRFRIPAISSVELSH